MVLRARRRWLALGLLWPLGLSLGCPRLDLDGDEDPFLPVVDGGLPTPDADAGSDAGPGPEPEPEPDPEPEVDAGPDGALLGEACNPATDPCAPGLYCLADLAGGPEAVCVVDCGFIDGNVVFELPEACGMYEACNTLYDDTASFVRAAVCLPIEYVRDRPCYAFEDTDACALDRVCIASEVSQGPGAETTIDALRCRDTCTLGAPDADEGCLFDDVCLPDPITTSIREPELTNPGNMASIIQCEPEDCEGDADGCPCSLDEGYRCASVGGAPRCARIRGLCGEPAPYLGEGDLITFDDLCNEENASRFCDRRAYLDLPGDAAQPLCVPLSEPPVEGDGICIGFCSQPAFDYNSDGNVDLIGAERAISLHCPDELVCETGFAASVGLYSTGVFEVACNPDLCPPGQPCGTCPSQVECVDSPFLFEPTCAAVFGTCQPPPPPPPDAGPADAGPPDAGAPLDAGGPNPPADAGPLDAGSFDAGSFDAGPFDAGPVDAGFLDAGSLDAGPLDAGPLDAGS